MITFIIRRLFATVLLLIIVSMITFAIFFLLPRLAGQTPYNLAAQYVGKVPIPSQIHAMEARLGLNEPLQVQYGRFLKGIVAGETYSTGSSKVYCPAPCLGYSWKNQQPVWPLLTSNIPVTLSLAAGAAVIWLFSGVAIGVLSALKRGSIIDRLSMGTALLGVSLPIFFTGAIALFLFSFHWHIFNVQYVGITTNPLLWAKNLVLPWITLAFLYSALYARLTRAGMLETMNEDYIRTARAKGVPEGRIVVRHLLRNALNPIITLIGLSLPATLSGAVVTESVFNYPGMGLLFWTAATTHDFPILLGFTVVIAAATVVGSLLADVLYAVADPRIRYM